MQYKILTDDFMKQYSRFPDNMTTFGKFVYLRTYSRPLLEEKRREYWRETVRRAVEFNLSLDKNNYENLTDAYIDEGRDLFDTVFHLDGFLSGRTFWVGGTKAGYKYPMANFNCSFVSVNKWSNVTELFYALLVGAGVGFSALKVDVDQLTPIYKKLNVTHDDYNAIPKEERNDITLMRKQGNTVNITVGDSKEGWVKSLEYFIKVFTNHFDYGDEIENVRFNYDNVRPLGERLKTFGGHASGHQPLFEMFTKITEIFNQSVEDGLRPIDILDTCNMIANNVVVGGVRRSSEIALGDVEDEEFINAKTEMFHEDGNGNWVANQDILHRRMSNNSILFNEKPTREKLNEVFQKIKFFGEPAFINGEEAKRRNPNFKGINPCAEILLDSEQMCNLVTVNVDNHVDSEDDGTTFVDGYKLYMTTHLLTRASYRMTMVELELANWSEKQLRDRLLGVSLTGLQDAINRLGFDHPEEQYIFEEQIYTHMRNTAHISMETYAEQSGLNESILVTAIKPEGTLSTLPTVSSGVHYSHSPFYVRRVRINATDVLVEVAKELNIPIFPESGQKMEDATTLVLEFPLKAPKGRTKNDASAIEQLETYKRTMEYYTDHNTSITVHVREHEWDGVEQWIWDNWDSFVGISFISHSDDENATGFELTPYESITEEEYNERVSKLALDKDMFDLLLQKERFEDLLDNTEGAIDVTDCSGGACPII